MQTKNEIRYHKMIDFMNDFFKRKADGHKTESSDNHKRRLLGFKDLTDDVYVYITITALHNDETSEAIKKIVHRKRSKKGSV